MDEGPELERDSKEDDEEIEQEVQSANIGKIRNDQSTVKLKPNKTK